MPRRTIDFDTIPSAEYFDERLNTNKIKNFYKCADCGIVCRRYGSRQVRCPSCQEIKRRLDKKTSYEKNKQYKIERQEWFCEFMRKYCKPMTKGV